MFLVCSYFFANFNLNKMWANKKENDYSHNRTIELPIQSPFTNNHNNHPLSAITTPLVICSVLQVPLNKNQCGYCGKVFFRGPLATVSFDIVIKHKEKRQHLKSLLENRLSFLMKMKLCIFVQYYFSEKKNNIALYV